MSKAHPHGELMVQYALDALETARPWQRWEWFNSLNKKWQPLPWNPSWAEDQSYRRKQETVNIKEKKGLPKPMTKEPEMDSIVFLCDLSESMVMDISWTGGPLDRSFFNSGVCFDREWKAREWLEWWQKEVMKEVIDEVS